MGACDEALGVSLGETAPSADDGGSSAHEGTAFPFVSNAIPHVQCTPRTFTLRRLVPLKEITIQA